MLPDFTKAGQAMNKAVSITVGMTMGAGACAASLYFLRRRNKAAFSIMDNTAALSTKSRYETNDHIVAIEGTYPNGFHFIPTTRTHPGTVVVFGGSEGSPAYEQAKELSSQGFAVMSLLFFGQPNQVPTLARVPLERFAEVTAFIDATIDQPRPITVIGTSKGAEFSTALAAYGFAVDNLITFAPADHFYPGLDFHSHDELPSFTYQGNAVPSASFRTIGARTYLTLLWDLIAHRPPHCRENYVAAATNSGPAAVIDLSGFAGHAVSFAGACHALWQSEIAARTLARESDRFEAFVFPKAVHRFAEDITQLGTGWEHMYGGTADGAARAYQRSLDIMLDRLARWHGDLTSFKE